MKKINLLFTSIILFSCIFLEGCFNPVFYEIRNDVSPEPKTLNSPINQVTRFTTTNNVEFLTVVSDGGIRYKRADAQGHTPWLVYPSIPVQLHKYDFFSSSHTGEQLVGIYASSDTLFLLTAAYFVDGTTGITYPGRLTLWGNKSISCTNNSIWNACNKNDWIIIAQGQQFLPISIDANEYYHSNFSIFQTNTPKKENRKVFLRTGKTSATIKYYEIKDTTPLVTPLTESSDYYFIGEPTTKCAYSAVYFNSKVYFFNGYTATTNENSSDDATKFYYSNGNQLFYGYENSGKIETKPSISMNASISSLAVCSDVLLIGCGNFNASSSSSTGGGIYKTALTEGIPSSTLSSFTTNAQFQITPAYFVTTLLNATPENSELSSCLYCGTQVLGSESSSSANLNNVGLWSYYPGRGNWNFE